MFDMHAHIGTYFQDALVATSKIEEFDDVKNFKYHSYGSLSFINCDLNLIEEEIKKDDLGLIGEVGLDKRFDFSNQATFFENAIKLSKKYDRSLIIHLVGHQDVFFNLLDIYSPIPPFLVHGFTSSFESAKRIINYGGYISLSPRAEKTKDFKKLLKLPFFLETDMPTGDDETKTLKLWYNKVSEELGVLPSVLEEIIDDRRTIFTPWKINWKRSS